MKKSNANFHYTVEHYGPMHYIAIVDFGGPYESVHNDIQEVVADILGWEGISDTRDYFVIFKEADSTWDGYNLSNREILHLGDDNPLDAAKHFFKLKEGEQEIQNEIYERMDSE